MIRSVAIIAALALANGAGAQDAPRHAPIIETPPEPGIVQGCGHYVVLASLPTLDAAFARQDALGLSGTGVIDTDEVDTMTDGLHAVVYGPFDTPERAARRRAEVLDRAPDAYVKAGCHAAATVDGDAGRSPTQTVPLARGVYERTRAACAAPALATLRVWDGEGLQSRNATDCTFRIERRAGDLYGGTNLCTDPATGETVETGLSLRIAGPDRVRVAEIGGDGPVGYVRCPGAAAGLVGG